jgi:RNA 3'-terminal phosphate cyclase (ATP)
VNSTWIQLDGAQGEGGGQILRTALTLAMITGQAFRLDRIRAKRAKPGLLRQHLTAVQAAAEICGAQVDGASPGSQSLHFVPGPIRGGDYRFAIGTAGSCTLVLQTVLPALWFADKPASRSVSGGTHNPAAPPADFLMRAWLPLMRRMGIQMDITLVRHGFYPAGGGEVRAEVAPCRPAGLNLNSRGDTLAVHAKAIVAGVPEDVARRELAQLGRRLPDLSGDIVVLPQQEGPGNVLLVELEHAELTEVFAGFGERGVSAEKVANQVAQRARAYLDSGAAVGGYLADQLLLPMALAGSGRFTTCERSDHLLTNLAIIGKFLPVDMQVTPAEGGWLVAISG